MIICALVVALVQPSITAAAPPVASSGPALEISFIAEDPNGPALVVTLENTGRRRSVSWAFLGAVPTGARARGELVDEGQGAGLLPLPVTPRGAGLIERGGALALTVDNV